MKIALIGYGWLAKHFHNFLEDRYSKLNLLVTNTGPNTTLFNQTKNTVTAKELKLFGEQDQNEVDWLRGIDRVYCFLTPSKDYLKKVESLYKLCEDTSKFVLISSTGVFSEAGTFSESSEFNATTLRSKNLCETEDFVLSRSNGYIIRSSGQIGPDRYPARSLALKNDFEIEDGIANVIHSDDLVRILDLFLDGDFTEKVIHAVSPYHPLKSQFYSEQAQRLGLTLPLFKKGSSERTINSEVLKELGFVFKNAACV